jgi:hypothetical protein
MINNLPFFVSTALSFAGHPFREKDGKDEDDTDKDRREKAKEKKAKERRTKEKSTGEDFFNGLSRRHWKKCLCAVVVMARGGEGVRW